MIFCLRSGTLTVSTRNETWTGRTCSSYRANDMMSDDSDSGGELVGKPLVPFCGDGRDSAFLVDLGRDGIDVSGKRIKVTDGSNKDAFDTGAITWDGAIILSKFLSKNHDVVEGRRVLELGAGTGLSGLAAAAAGATTVVITDLPYCIERIEGNVRLNAELAKRVVVADCGPIAKNVGRKVP